MKSFLVLVSVYPRSLVSRSCLFFSSSFFFPSAFFSHLSLPFLFFFLELTEGHCKCEEKKKKTYGFFVCRTQNMKRKSVKWTKKKKKENRAQLGTPTHKE